MANSNAARKSGSMPGPAAVGGRKTANSLRDSVFALTSEMEEPLRHALQMVHVIELVEARDDQDKEAIGFVAHEAATKLQIVSRKLRAIFAACRAA